MNNYYYYDGEIIFKNLIIIKLALNVHYDTVAINRYNY